MRVVVSGTSSGIGLAIAERFLREGHEVTGFDILGPAISHERYRHLQADVRDDEAIATAGPLDPHILISAAGTLEESEAIDVNLKGAISFTSQFIESSALKSVLFIASASARNGSEFPLYVASKAGLVGYMKNLALSCAKRGVTCNSISPGGVVTRSNGHILDDPRLYQAVLDETLLGKWAEPEEVADLAYFLTVQNRSITGEDVLIDNGEMLKSNFIW